MNTKKPGWSVATKTALPFKQPTQFPTRPQLLRMPENVPQVHLNALALHKIHLLVGLIHMEVGWLGTAYRNGDTITITDVYLFEQDVSYGHTEISTESMANLMTEILQHEGGDEIFNNIRFWGHSHGSGSVMPSTQDDNTMSVFKDFGADFFVRGIFNRVGALSFSVYDWERGLAFHDVPWTFDATRPSRTGFKKLREQVLQEMQEKVIHRPPPVVPIGGYKHPLGFIWPGVTRSPRSFGGNDD